MISKIKRNWVNNRPLFFSYQPALDVGKMVRRFMGEEDDEVNGEPPETGGR